MRAGRLAGRVRANARFSPNPEDFEDVCMRVGGGPSRRSFCLLAIALDSPFDPSGFLAPQPASGGGAGPSCLPSRRSEAVLPVLR
jgi:hypothetical protein